MSRIRTVRRPVQPPPTPPPAVGQEGAQLAQATEIDEVIAPTEKLMDSMVKAPTLAMDPGVEINALISRAIEPKAQVRRAFQKDRGVDLPGEISPIGRMHELGMPLRLRA